MGLSVRNNSRVCPQCRKLNSGEDARCYSCGAPLAGVSALWLRLSEQRGLITLFLISLSLFNFALLVLIEGRMPVGMLGIRASRTVLIGLGALSMDGRHSEVFRFLSATFVHGGALHLALNLFALRSLGSQAEEHFGGPRVMICYVLTGVIGFFVSSVWYRGAPVLTLGASGAIFGLIGLEVGQLFRRRDPRAKDVFINYAVMAVALALVFPVNNPAHLGGFVSGAGLGWYLEGERKTKERETLVRWLSLGGVLLCLGSVAFALFVFATEGAP